MARVRGALANEDRLEAVSMAVAYYVDRMNRDTDKELPKVKDAALDDELVKFMRHAIGGGQVAQPSWQQGSRFR